MAYIGVNDTFLSLPPGPNDLSLFSLNQELQDKKKWTFYTKIELEKYWGTKIISFVWFVKFKDQNAYFIKLMTRHPCEEKKFCWPISVATIFFSLYHRNPMISLFFLNQELQDKKKWTFYTKIELEKYWGTKNI